MAFGPVFVCPVLAESDATRTSEVIAVSELHGLGGNRLERQAVERTPLIGNRLLQGLGIHVQRMGHSPHRLNGSVRTHAPGADGR